MPSENLIHPLLRNAQVTGDFRYRFAGSAIRYDR